MTSSGTTRIIEQPSITSSEPTTPTAPAPVKQVGGDMARVVTVFPRSFSGFSSLQLPRFPSDASPWTISDDQMKHFFDRIKCPKCIVITDQSPLVNIEEQRAVAELAVAEADRAIQTAEEEDAAATVVEFINDPLRCNFLKIARAKMNEQLSPRQEALLKFMARMLKNKYYNQDNRLKGMNGSAGYEGIINALAESRVRQLVQPLETRILALPSGCEWLEQLIATMDR